MASYDRSSDHGDTVVFCRGSLLQQDFFAVYAEGKDRIRTQFPLVAVGSSGRLATVVPGAVTTSSLA